MQEVELKLELAPDDADALAAAGLFAGDPQVIHQQATYYDTPDHALAKAGFSLRIRHDGTARTQTIKAGGTTAGLFVRSEWEMPVSDDVPVLDDATPLPAMFGDVLAKIIPLFTVENQRQIWLQDGIEIALDRGRVLAGDREATVCEVELEHKEGDPAALFALARRIAASVPVAPGVLTKAERGYRLINAAPSPTKAQRVVLTPGISAGEAFTVIAQACLRQFGLNAPLVIDHQDGVALHQARVALRRLRSALTIFKPILGDRREPISRHLRWLAGELGKARDLDVLIGRTTDDTLRDRLITARAEAYVVASAAILSQRTRSLMIDLVEWIALGAWQGSTAEDDLRHMPAREFAAGTLDRLRRKVKRGGRNLADLADEPRHDLRKSAKKLRYAAEFFAGLYDRKKERRRRKRFISALADLQDELGALNDIAAAPQVLRSLGLESEASPASAERKALLQAADEAFDGWIDTKRFWR
ncbi:CHAD domain-containing protein [Altererythrobacter xixiisoli]|uniref:CHAD domain-containing protein n=2 Tax=Croceibacterium xixiisoli TaxID=1476466 RepID=A0A6I4TTD4_9SPHN|nr:CHAD domain-containing protein [Croceibacterium xixiisoli]